MKTNSQKKRINIALLEADLSQADIAREISTTRQYVHDVIAGRKRSRKVEGCIALRTGRPVETLFLYRQHTDPLFQNESKNFESI